MSSIGVAVVGTGFGQKVHLPGFKAHPRTQVVAVYHRDRDKAQAIAQTHNIPHASSALEEIVALPEVQAVSISTPPFLHYEMAKTVLQAGKHLLLEKPTTLSATGARELYHIARANNLVVTLDFEYRFVPAWQRLAELLAEDYVGEKRLIKIDWLVPSRADASRPWNWYSRKDMGGGALGALASHTFDYMNWLFGAVQKLCAQLSTSIPQRLDPLTGEMKLVDADDTCMLMLELADGTPCQINISSAVYANRTHSVEVYGDRGTLVLVSQNQKDYVHGFHLWAAAAGQPPVELEIPMRLGFDKTYTDGRIAPFIRVVNQWVQGIDSGESLIPSIREGVYSQLLMDLSHASHQQRSWVDVPDLDKYLTRG
ncbi:Gfo/Idh/MocA family protein [Chroococcidiopsis sp. CCNUC1]|uniref:Gfo/Idh/MocA family protein n=1 Tax=Chroococcidiopsis sp. CCNUC1 TaxID=2653189 RepID=UPI002020FAB9|nr:Gfo/Idh/MocA family oxidoreductase [Chroococcidiopsis sp. CCNUC1]URD50287.1 Gfo/Idh/MocA family oxidoreductase [Chroococcidiopsis sp. CCNUC1]